ncbi:DUF3310 domain-containing protein [Leucobacter sp. USCH14]|uniref:DUF3310 domain-containing protein n=1 Tax=Leucobacter sp. USCH14 TaxID=3024838 RepID=UPI0030ACDBE1
MSDQINPDHYQGDAVMTFIEQFELGFATGNAVKYISRAGKKAGAELLTDLEKARWYIDREIQRVRAARATATEIEEA